MKVGFLIEGMSGSPSGTWTRFAALVRRLSSSGIEIHVRGTEGVHDALGDLPVESFQLRARRNQVARFFFRRKEIDAFARDTGVQIVHLEAPPFVSAKTVPTIASIHDLRHFYPESRRLLTGEAVYQIFFLPFHIRNVSRVFALSEWSSNEIQRIFRIPSSEICVVPPWIENIPLHSRKESRPRSTVEYAIALGHIEPRKNLEVVVAAEAESEWPQDVQLWIAGTDQGSLEKISELSCSIGGNAIFLGPVSEEEKRELLEGAVAALLPSKIEGFGIVALEAPAFGTPVIVAQSSGLDELSAHPSASAKPDSPEDWAKAVNAIKFDPKLREEIVLLQRKNSDKFSASSTIEKVLSSYRSLARVHQLAQRETE